jgi:glycosyltransferase involved in cell wall biosynthesis
VTGEVADLMPYLEDAAVVVAPIRMGGGMRVKVLEALAAGKAVVTTPLAAEGLDVTGGDQLEIAAGEDEFHTAVLRLLRDEDRRHALGARAWKWSREHLGWDAAIAQYDGLYRSLADGREVERNG